MGVGGLTVGNGLFFLFVLILPIIALLGGIFLKEKIKKFVIWVLDVGSAMMFLLLVATGGIVVGLITYEFLHWFVGLILGMVLGFIVSSLLFGILYLFLNMNNSLEEIRKNTK
jgi:hypothetical protein